MITVQFTTTTSATVAMIALCKHLYSLDESLAEQRVSRPGTDDDAASAFELREMVKLLEQLATGIGDRNTIVRQYRAMLGQLKNKELIDHIIG
jgi:hypothetical protein